ncbi:LexA family transcriptional regulator [Clostridium botulinum]|uniref:LexA family protein n=1 Tax=Clostridium botulinum TaxID=1491 RepID=UPI000159210F|nr:S24 family peptidase [Clostridium botulinum]ABS32450.1 LexA repressor [Clostridium botulinum A str. ATCC 19397]ABS38313.1 LexA repressor [Clostridium botulinum A str. Hall]AWB16827.1 LexA family transcriptional regulator [Clostridium botulinum]EGT5614699.1 LexA family transcriptional regulator [Clostridium botulinum]EGT5621852.1 LexA family transcriptional regulator [Clostridium botulinum]
MKLESGQNRIAKSKHLGYGLLRGSKGTGKTTAAIYRGIYLKNQYCMYDKDKVLILSKNEENLNYIKNIYNDAEKTGVQYITLFSYNEDKLHFSSIYKIINKYFWEYIENNNLQYELASEKEKLAIIEECINDIKNEYKNLKYIDIKYSKFFLEEIQWMKDCMYYDLEEYKKADRIGRKTKKGEGPQRIIKNSKIREAVFKIMLLYNEKLKYKNLVDYSDVVSMSLKEASKNKENKFNHIIVDEAQNFTKLELKFIEALGRKNIYSSILFIADKEKNSNPKGWITKGRKLNNLQLGFEFKRFNLNKKIGINVKEEVETYIDDCNLKRKASNINTKNEDVSNVDNSNSEDKGLDKNIKNEWHKDKVNYDMDKFEYVDMKHRRSYEFSRGLGSNEEIIVEDQGSKEEYKEDELTKLPVFNDIAAGEPILMNPCVEGEFNIPKYWVRGMKNCFILKVKGDSMIGANIEDGDHVVIKRQQMAENKDIVAVNLDGSATLKRLLIKKSGAVLMPENKKYKPIEILEEGASIIGIAVGIIKGK